MELWELTSHICNSFMMKNIRFQLFLLASFVACQPCGNDNTATKIQFYNQSGASLVFGVFVKSPIMAQRLGLSQNKSSDHGVGSTDHLSRQMRWEWKR